MNKQGKPIIGDWLTRTISDYYCRQISVV